MITVVTVEKPTPERGFVVCTKQQENAAYSIKSGCTLKSPTQTSRSKVCKYILIQLQNYFLHLWGQIFISTKCLSWGSKADPFAEVAYMQEPQTCKF